MKLLFLIVVALLVSAVAYLFSSACIKSNKKKNKKFNCLPVKIASVFFVILLALILYGAYSTAHQPDLQCTSSYTTTSKPPKSLTSTNEYFLQGNYDYDSGNCRQAVADYAKAIQHNPKNAQAYNNRAYTNMRLRDYKDALPDLNKAIQLNPNYVQALMNRGDIHNYYYQIDRQSAIADYKRVIALTGSNGGQTSVCGHLMLARNNGWTLGAYVDYFRGAFATCY